MLASGANIPSTLIGEKEKERDRVEGGEGVGLGILCLGYYQNTQSLVERASSRVEVSVIIVHFLIRSCAISVVKCCSFGPSARKMGRFRAGDTALSMQAPERDVCQIEAER